MSRYLLAPFPLHGHVVPMTALAAELVGRGGHVTVAISAAFADVFRDLGCEIVELDIMPRSAVAEERSVKRKFGRLRWMRDVYRERVRLSSFLKARIAELRPDVVVTDIMSLWGVHAAEAAGVPCAAFHVTYAVNEQVLLDDVRRLAGPKMAAFVKWSGFAKIQPGLRRRVHRNAALALVNVIEELQPHRETFDERFHFVGPLRPEPDRGDSDLPWDRIENERTLYVSTGTFFTRGAWFFRKVAEAFAGDDWFVVMATSHTDPEEIGHLPANVVARRYVPQSAVLEHCEAFLTHAGMNSAMEGLLLGLPMVIVPRASDQKEIARKLVALGTGVVVDHQAGPEEFRTALDHVVNDPAIRTALAENAQRLRQSNGPAAAADQLEKLIVGGRAA
ncbi:MGT family glycosyltransferase [Saccharothrix coeruleofusca]|uniref:nucleotide disphospho-sugar-binding domain-containing protein n=1 Tax=Saccharothrix coeruleofusca TaxID=33919 RepID=UPI001AE3768E|nr:nucleotide disphospho-sugar-binding domain-containing protein [Saccharothrix coeruleofusca]MBP2334769.1 MGT family glycosyltransferase [Saccharothrix coeruleofusca]